MRLFHLSRQDVQGSDARNSSRSVAWQESLNQQCTIRWIFTRGNDTGQMSYWLITIEPIFFQPRPSTAPCCLGLVSGQLPALRIAIWSLWRSGGNWLVWIAPLRCNQDPHHLHQHVGGVAVAGHRSRPPHTTSRGLPIADHLRTDRIVDALSNAVVGWNPDSGVVFTPTA